MRAASLVTLLVLVLGVSLIGAAPRQRPTFSSRTLGVRVDVMVTEHNRPVAGLAAADFELRDNGVVQKFELTTAADAPINAVLALDTSASTAGTKLQNLLAATRTFLDRLKPADRVALTTFSHAVVPRVPLTSDFAEVRTALGRIEATGDTAALDGVHVALMATHTESGRSLVLVCTDGRDTSSWLEADEVVDSAKRSSAVIYAVAAERARGWSVLKDLTDATGGHMVDLTAGGDLSAEFQKILEDFRSRYILTFAPSGVTEGGLHRLDVRVRRSGMTVKARPAYIGTGSAGERR